MIARHAAVIAATVAALAGVATGLEAQSLRTFTTFRRLHGERTLNARVQLFHSSLRVFSGRAEELYRLAFTGDEALLPIDDYDAVSNTLTVRHANDDGAPGDSSIAVAITTSDHHKPSATTLALSPSADAALKLELVAVDVDMELGGIRVVSLDLESVAGETTIRFSQPNATPCQHARVTAAVGDLSVIGLGNSRCETMKVQGALARQITLDFSGAWPATATVDAKVIAGQLKLRIPKQVGVRLTIKKKLLASFEPNGLAQQGNSFLSANYETAAQHLDIDASTVLGSTAVEWIGE